jgi:hypothetical protein
MIFSLESLQSFLLDKRSHPAFIESDNKYGVTRTNHYRHKLDAASINIFAYDSTMK